MFTQESFYKSKEWESFRRIVIDQNRDENGNVICAVCGKPIVKKYDLIVHHKQEINDLNVNDHMISLNPDNCECVHFSCHNRVHDKHGGKGPASGFRPKTVYLVWGPPCAGKSTWVREQATEADIIVDVDEIWNAVTRDGWKGKNDLTKSVVFEIRDKLYEIIKHRSGTWETAYVIAGAPRETERKRIMQRIGTDKSIFIEEAKDVCLKRAEAKDERWAAYVREWFDQYEAGQARDARVSPNNNDII